MCRYAAVLILLLPVLILLGTCEHRFGCEEKYCSTKVGPCPPIDCENGRVIKNATTCGCCDVCVEYIKANDTCRKVEYSSIPRKECEPGHWCDLLTSTCVPMDTQCMRDQRRFEEGVVSHRSRPECDDFGFYQPVVCESGLLCYCVNKNGTRIFGTSVDLEKDAMDCNCSRDFDEFPRKHQVEPGNFLRCTPNGNYDLLQCTEEWCYCIEDDPMGPAVRPNASLRALPCYRTSFREKAECWLKRSELLKKKLKQEEQGGVVIGLDLPKCDLDGSFAPVQCNRNSCYCVSRNGAIFEDTRSPRNYENHKDMNCRCVRDKETLNLAGQRSNATHLKCVTGTSGPNGQYKDGRIF